MAERRNAKAHSLNVVTFDGVSEAGKGNGINTRLTSRRDRGVGFWSPEERLCGAHRPARYVGGDRGRGLERAEVGEGGHDPYCRCR